MVDMPQLNRAFVEAGMEEEFAEIVARHTEATGRGSLLCEISEQFRDGP